MKNTTTFMAFPDNIIEKKSNVKFEALTIILPENVITDLDYAIGQINHLSNAFFITYRVTELDLHRLATLQVHKASAIEIAHLQIQAQSNGVYAHVFAQIDEHQDQYWFVELKNYRKEQVYN